MSVRPHRTIWLPLDGFAWNLIFENLSVEKIRVSLQPDKNNGYFTWRGLYIYDSISLNSSQNEICLRKIVWRKSKHILCSVTFFWKSCCCLWDNVQKYGRDRQATADIIQPRKNAIWIPDNEGKNTDTRSYLIVIAFPRVQWLRERISVFRYTHSAGLV